VKPRILICGQKPRRREELERAFGARAKLAFHYNQNLRHLKDQARGAHRIFICIDAANHNTTAMCKNVAPHRVVLLTGATANLKAAITEFLASLENAPC